MQFGGAQSGENNPSYIWFEISTVSLKFNMEGLRAEKMLLPMYGSRICDINRSGRTHCVTVKAVIVSSALESATFHSLRMATDGSSAMHCYFVYHPP